MLGLLEELKYPCKLREIDDVLPQCDVVLCCIVHEEGGAKFFSTIFLALALISPNRNQSRKGLQLVHLPVSCLNIRYRNIKRTFFRFKMNSAGKRRGEQSDQGNQAKKPLHSFESTSSVSNKDMALPDLVPYDIVQDLTLVLPSQPLTFSAGFSKQKYAHDLWNIFSEEAFVDPKLAEMHKAWFKAGHPTLCAHYLTECNLGPKT